MVSFFIHRPIFASSIAVIMVLAGAICYFLLPVSQFPDITPPQVVVSATYPGASAQVVADTVTTPLEQQINGVQGMTYMSSSSSNDGSSTITVTFDVGYPLSIAAVDVQNRVAQAAASLPPIVNQDGVTIKKQNPNFVLIVNLVSPDSSVDPVALSNYAYLQVVDPLKRVPGVGDVQIFGERRYSMRIWLDPDKLAKLGITAVDVQQAVAEQNVQVAAGKIGQSPAPDGTPFEMQVNATGRLSDPEQFGDIVVRSDPASGAIVRMQDIARIELGALQYSSTAVFGKDPTVVLAVYQMPGSNALDLQQHVKDKMEELVEALPQGNRIRPALRHHAVRHGGQARRDHHAQRSIGPCHPRRLHLPAELAHHAHSDHRHSGVVDRDAGRHAGDGLLAEHAEPARHGAGDRAGRGRRHRGGRERRTATRKRSAAAEGRTGGNVRSDGTDHRHDRRADGGFRAGGVHSRRDRPALQSVRSDGRDLGRHLGIQFADAQSGVECCVPAPPSAWQFRAVPLVQCRVRSSFSWLRAAGAGSDRMAMGRLGTVRRRSGSHLFPLAAHSVELPAGRGSGLFLRRDPAPGRRLAATHRRGCRKGEGNTGRHAGGRHRRIDQRPQLPHQCRAIEFGGGVRNPQAVGRAAAFTERLDTSWPTSG